MKITKTNEFNGKRAKITNDHPHEGAVATCHGYEHTHAGGGLRFYNPNSEEIFYVFDTDNLIWIT